MTVGRSADANVRLRRVHDTPRPDDGVRVLVDRIWPRGITRERAALDEWCKAVSPSTDLRTWYGHDAAKFAEFATRYRAELTEPVRAQALAHLRDLAGSGRLTLLTATRAVEISAASVLVDVLGRRASAGEETGTAQ